MERGAAENFAIGERELLGILSRFGVRSQGEAAVRLAVAGMREAHQKARRAWREREKKLTAEWASRSASLDGEVARLRSRVTELSDELASAQAKQQAVLLEQQVAADTALRRAKTMAKKKRQNDLKELRKTLESSYEKSMKRLSLAHKKELRKISSVKSRVPKEVERQIMELETQTQGIIKAKSERVVELDRLCKDLEERCAQLDMNREQLEASLEDSNVRLSRLKRLNREKTTLLKKANELVVDLRARLSAKEAGSRSEKKQLEEARALDRAKYEKELKDKSAKSRTTLQHLTHEVRSLKEKHRAEISTIHERVKEVVRSKDQQVQRFQEEAIRLRQKVAKLERYLLQQKERLSEL